VSGGISASIIYPDLKFPLWVYFKFLIWFIFLTLPFVKKFRDSNAAISIILILVVLELYLGLLRPAFKSNNEISAPAGFSNGPPPAATMNRPSAAPGNIALLPGPPPFCNMHAPPPAKPYKPPVPAQ
jgi:hypothetical protein